MLKNIIDESIEHTYIILYSALNVCVELPGADPGFVKGGGGYFVI